MSDLATISVPDATRPRRPRMWPFRLLLWMCVFALGFAAHWSAAERMDAYWRVVECRAALRAPVVFDSGRLRQSWYPGVTPADVSALEEAYHQVASLRQILTRVHASMWIPWLAVCGLLLWRRCRRPAAEALLALCLLDLVVGMELASIWPIGIWNGGDIGASPILPLLSLSLIAAIWSWTLPATSLPLAVVPPPVDCDDYGTPRWETLATDLHCPICGYNLRGLQQPRCPECGYAFSWDSLIDEQRQKHPYLFEHQSKHNLWSWWRTLTAGLHPTRFWRELRPAHRIVPRRLAIYAAVMAAVTVSACLLALPKLSSARPKDLPPVFQAVVSLLSDSLQAMARLDPTGTWPGHPIVWVGCWGAWAILWPALTVALVNCFQATLRAASVRDIQLARCIIYAWDLTVPCGVLIAVAGLAGHALASGEIANITCAACLIAAIPVVTWRLVRALQLYLGVRGAWLVILASQFILGLAAATTVAALAGWG